MEKKLRHSRQREMIYEYLCSTCEHPSAEMIYEDLKKKIEGLSLGTVYRNLNQLAAQGTILRLTGIDGSDHYDGMELRIRLC